MEGQLSPQKRSRRSLGGRKRYADLPLVPLLRMDHTPSLTYLKATLEAIADGHLTSEIDRLLPWACSPTSSRSKGGRRPYR